MWQPVLNWSSINIICFEPCFKITWVASTPFLRVDKTNTNCAGLVTAPRGGGRSVARLSQKLMLIPYPPNPLPLFLRSFGEGGDFQWQPSCPTPASQANCWKFKYNCNSILVLIGTAFSYIAGRPLVDLLVLSNQVHNPTRKRHRTKHGAGHNRNLR